MTDWNIVILFIIFFLFWQWFSINDQKLGEELQQEIFERKLREEYDNKKA